MFRTAATAFACLALPLSAAATLPPTDFPADAGAVAMLCEAPAPEDGEGAADDAVFLEFFPELMANLQARAKGGTVLGAHFLENMDDGLLVIVGGGRERDAMGEALALLDENEAVIRDAHAALGAEVEHDIADVCRLIPIGPAAAMP